MADKPISDLTAATQINALDLFVLQQDGTAKKLTGQILMNWLVSFADGHGGIQSITKTDTNGLADTYTVTLSDTTTFSFTVTNGKGIAAVTKTATAGLVDTYTVSYNDGTATTFPVTNGKGIASWGKTGSQGLEDTYLVTYNDGTTFSYTVKNGSKGDTGDNAYIHIKYASQQPTEESPSIGDVPDRWMGVYTGTQVQPPAQYTDYKWYEVKGEKGDTGDAAAVISQEVVFQVSDSGTIYPSGAWSQQIPVVPQGKYLWTRSTVVFNSGAPQISYSVARFGLDGLGSVSSVNNVSPDSGGNVSLTAGDVEALPISGGSMTGPVYMDGQKLSGLNAPTDQDEAATKGYVDTNYVPQTRKVNGKALSEDVVLTAADVGARPSTWMPTASDVGALAPANLFHGTYTSGAFNFNSLTAPGIYWVHAANGSNKPASSNYGFLEVMTITYDSRECIQRFTDYGDKSMYMRTNINGWGSWVKIDASYVGAAAKSTLMEFSHKSLDANGNYQLNWYSSYPTTPGLYRVVSPYFPELPQNAGCNSYGTLEIVDGGSYLRHIYLDSNGLLYFQRTDGTGSKPSGTGWRLLASCDATANPWPGMTMGTVYKMAEQWNGKVVSAKLMNFGALPNSATKNVSLGLSNAANIVSVEAIWQRGTTFNGLTGGPYTSGYWFVSNGTYYYGVTTTSNQSSDTVYLLVKWTS